MISLKSVEKYCGSFVDLIMNRENFIQKRQLYSSCLQMCPEGGGGG